MSTITKEVYIPTSHKINLDVELPADCPTGAAVITLIVEAKDKQTQDKPPKPKNRIAELYGIYEGQIWTSDDFDAPLEDFAEYM